MVSIWVPKFIKDIFGASASPEEVAVPESSSLLPSMEVGLLLSRAINREHINEMSGEAGNAFQGVNNKTANLNMSLGQVIEIPDDVFKRADLIKQLIAVSDLTIKDEKAFLLKSSTDTEKFRDDGDQSSISLLEGHKADLVETCHWRGRPKCGVKGRRPAAHRLAAPGQAMCRRSIAVSSFFGFGCHKAPGNNGRIAYSVLQSI